MKKYLLLLAFLPFAAFGQHNYLSDKLATQSYTIQKIGSTIYAVPAFGSGLATYHGSNLTTVLQSAVDALTSGGLIQIKAGLYDNMSPIGFHTNKVTIRGEGRYNTILKLRPLADRWSQRKARIFYMNGADYITIENLQLDGNGHAQYYLDSRNETPTARSSGISISDSAYAVTPDVSYHTTIRNCYIHDFTSVGIVAEDAMHTLIEGCDLSNNYWAGFETYDPSSYTTVRNCYFDNTGTSIYGNNDIIENCFYGDAYNAHSWSASDITFGFESADGEGPYNTTVRNCIFRGDSTASAIWDFNGSHNTVLENIQIDMGGAVRAETYPVAIGLEKSNNIIMNNVKIYNFLHNGGVAIGLTDVNNASLSNITIDTVEYVGVMFVTSVNCRLTNSYICNYDGNPSVSIGAGCTDIYVTDNKLWSVALADPIVDSGTGSVLANNYNLALYYTKWTEETGIKNNAVVATNNGLTTGLIRNGSQNITVTSANANYICCLPTTDATTVGMVITGFVGSNGFELRPIAAQAATVYINGVTTNVEAAIPASSTFEITCITDNYWILKAWTLAGAERTPIVPDAI